MAQQEQFNAINHGWMQDDKENCLTVKWMKWKPAPNEARVLISNFYIQMFSNHVQILNVILSFICELPLILFILFFSIYLLEMMACECKERCNEACLCVANDLKCTDKCLCHDCGNCEEILYEEEAEIDFDSDDEDDEEE